MSPLDGSNSPFILERSAILQPDRKPWTQLLGDLLRMTARRLCQRYIVQVYRCFMFRNKKMNQQKEKMAHGLRETLPTDVSEVFCVCCSCKNISGNLSFLPKKEKVWARTKEQIFVRWTSHTQHNKVLEVSTHSNTGGFPWNIVLRTHCERFR